MKEASPIPATLIRGDGVGPEIVDATLQATEPAGPSCPQ